MQPSPIWIALMFALGFPVFWVGVCLLLGVLSGWRGLARIYPGRLASPEGTAWGSGTMGITSYRNCLKVAVGREGLGLSLFPLLAVGSPPLVIPWSSVSEVRRERVLGLFDTLQLRIDGSITLVLYGSAARLVEGGWHRHAQLAEAPAGLAPAAVKPA